MLDQWPQTDFKHTGNRILASNTPSPLTTPSPTNPFKNTLKVLRFSLENLAKLYGFSSTVLLIHLNNKK